MQDQADFEIYGESNWLSVDAFRPLTAPNVPNMSDPYTFSENDTNGFDGETDLPPYPSGRSTSSSLDSYAPVNIFYLAEIRVAMTPREVGDCLIGYKDIPNPNVERMQNATFYVTPRSAAMDVTEEEASYQNQSSIFQSLMDWIPADFFSCCLSSL